MPNNNFRHFLSNVPLHIWIGPHKVLEEKVYEHLHAFFCKNHRVNCSTLTMLNNRQHPSVQWIAPEKTYTRQTIEPLFKTLTFTLQEGDYYFFILEQAHLLTAAVGNSLLKTFEEPPAGYHFILLCENTYHVLPTILSRGIVTSFVGPQVSPYQELYKFLCQPHLEQIVGFNRIIEKNCPSEQEISQLLEQLFTFWTTEQENPKVFSALHILKKYSSKPPMPGSAKHFLRSLFLELSSS